MKLKTLILTCTASLAMLAYSALAGLQLQLNGGTNNITSTFSAGATNTYALPGDTTGSFTNGIPVGSTGGNSFFDVSRCDDLEWGVSFQAINTTTNTVSVVLRWAGSVDVAYWTNNYFTQTYVAAASSTNWVVLNGSQQNSLPAVALRAIEIATPVASAGGLTLTNVAAKGFTKTGI